MRIIDAATIENRINEHLGSYTDCKVKFTDQDNSVSRRIEVEVNSEAFRGVSMINRHRMVYAALVDEIEDGSIHALEILGVTHPGEPEP